MYTCENCEAEFEIQYVGKDPVEYCPFCGENLEVLDWENEIDIEWDE